MREPSSKTEADPSGVVTVEEARKIAQRFIAGHFGNTGKEGPRIRIPADPSHDDDLRLMAFIDRAAAVEAERDELKRKLDERPTVSEFEKRTRSAEASAMELLEIVDIFDPSGRAEVEDVVEAVRAAVAERDHLRERVAEADHALDHAIAERDELCKALDDEKHVTIAQDAADRLRRGIETLRDEARENAALMRKHPTARRPDVVEEVEAFERRLDAILRGES